MRARLGRMLGMAGVVLCAACSTDPGVTSDASDGGGGDGWTDGWTVDAPAELPGVEGGGKDIGWVDLVDLVDGDLVDGGDQVDEVDLVDDVDGVDGGDLVAPVDGVDMVDVVDVDEAPCELDLPCDDGNPCTLDDECFEDGCIGTKKDCSDGKECTFDWCNDGLCENSQKPGWCWIAGQCWKEGDANPNNPCLECITSHKIFTWSADDSNSCDDGNACSDPDGCLDGQCIGTVVSCDDDNFCTEDGCYFGECTHVPLNGIACEDGDYCTLDDVCFAGECAPGTDVRLCDDYNLCTKDSCDPQMGCLYIPDDGGPCLDADLCTENDYCQSGICMPGEAITCDDGSDCTNDSCSPLIGCKYINNSNPCDDGNPCSVGDQCLGGLCKKGPDELDCEDDNTCTQEWCTPFVGCQYKSIVAPCSDGNGCTFGDHCEDAECVSDWTMDCADDNPCTDDFCSEASGCANVFNSNPCDDGNQCTLGDQCVMGSCAAGVLPLTCFDENPCATGYCDPGLGCVMEPEDGKGCDDSDECTVDDFCLGGECQPGDPDVVDCSDGKECTVDWCDPLLGCMHENIEALCNDNDLCTEGDACVEGLCVGTPVSCDDDNACTVDSCMKDQGCKYSVIVSAFCQPQLVIDYPPRAAELLGPPTTVEVKGHVVHNAAPVAWVTINGDKVAVEADDTFTYSMAANQGMNIIEAETYDLWDGHDKIVQAYLLSSEYVPMNAANPNVSMIKDSIMIYLGQNVWDDDVPDPNDFATFFTYFFNAMDLAAMLPNPLYENGQYKIKAKNMKYGAFDLDIICINGGIHMNAFVPDLSLDLDADSKKWYLPDASGDVSASLIDIDMDVMLSVDAAGNVQALLKNVDVDVKGLDVSLDGALGFLLNWLVDFFEGTFAGMLEDQVEAALKDTLPDTLESALQDLAFDSSFEVPPFLGDGPPTTLQMKSNVSSVNFSPIGGVLGLKAGVVTPKGVSLDSKGSIRRGKCLGNESPFSFWMLDEIEMGIHDDFLNQIPYAMWWAGLLEIPLDGEALGGGSFEEYGIEDLDLTATALLPPVLSHCGKNSMEIQMGDLQLQASMVMFGMDVEVTMYSSFTAGIVVGVGSKDGETVLEMAVTDIGKVLLEVATVSENLIGSEDSLRALVISQVLPVFLEQLTGDSLASFPLPEMDMTGLIPGVPGDAKLSMTPKSTYREKGYTVITGSVHE
jgi:hypothetical protein